MLRSGDLSGPAAVSYSTFDDGWPVCCDETVTNFGAALDRCDYTTVVGTLTFAAGKAQKTISLPLIDDSYVEPPEAFQVRLSNPVGAPLLEPLSVAVMLNDNETGPGGNAIFASPFFVRQQYLDFLSREPDTAGFNAWLGVLNGCGDINNGDPNSPSAGCDRVTVSASCFGSPEFQLKGFFVFRFYRVAFNRLPQYTEVVPDMSSVTGQTAAEVFQQRPTSPPRSHSALSL